MNWKGIFKRKRRAKKEPTLTEFMILFKHCVPEHQSELMARLNAQPKPKTICGKKVIESLNHISYGMLSDIQDALKMENDVMKAILECVQIITDASVEELANESVNKIFGIINWMTKEIERINKLFADIKTSYTSEELKAGVKSLDFGTFGVLDWYAKRMGIANQNDVRDIAWVRIYQCMKMDNEQSEYERRLHKAYNNKVK